jgi:hypothetical protein
VALTVAWFRRQIWGLIKFTWWLFRATPKVRLYVAKSIFLCVLKILNGFVESGVFRRSRMPKPILGAIMKTDLYLNVWQERLMVGRGRLGQ